MANQKEPLICHEVPVRPWQNVATNLFSWNTDNYVVVVDYYSRFYEVERLQSTTTTSVIKKIKGVFVRHGIPGNFISDTAHSIHRSLLISHKPADLKMQLRVHAITNPTVLQRSMYRSASSCSQRKKGCHERSYHKSVGISQHPYRWYWITGTVDHEPQITFNYASNTSTVDAKSH